MPLAALTLGLTLALWPCGPMALWPFGPMALWPYGKPLSYQYISAAPCPLLLGLARSPPP